MENLSRNKKIAYVAASVIILGLLAYAAYRAFMPSGTTTTRQQQEQTIGGGQIRPPAGGGETGAGGFGSGGVTTPISTPEGKILTQLTDFPIIAPSLNKGENKVLFYKKDGGDLFSIDFEGKNLEKISNITVLGLTEAVWSNEKDRAAVFYLDGEIIKGFLQIGSTTTSLPQGIKSLVFSPDGKNLAYLVERGENVDLIIADAFGKNPKITYTTPIRDAKILWPTPDRISLQTAPSGVAEGFLFGYSRSSGILSRIAGPLFGLTSLWSPNGSQIAASITNTKGKNTRLLVLDAAGQIKFETTATTLSEKCAWADELELFCAIPKSSLNGYLMPDDYLRGELNTTDRIMAVNLENKSVRELLNIKDFDVSNLLITKKKDYLLFINRPDGTLWSLKLD